MSHVALEHHLSEAEQARSIDSQKFAMWLFIASETVIFSIMIAGYILFRAHEPDIVHELHEAIGFGGTLIVTLNSFLLLTSSWAMVMGLREIQRGNRAGLIRWFWLVVFLGLAFLGIQFYEYQRLATEGVTLYFNPDSEFARYGMYFYTPTAFHGAHVFVGVLWCLLVMNRARKGRYERPGNPVGVEVFGLYWHYVDIVWVFLFTLIYLV